MNNTLKVAIAAAAVVVVGVVGLNLLPGSAQPGVGAAPLRRRPRPRRQARPAHRPIPLLPTSGVIEPGRYRSKPVGRGPDDRGARGLDSLGDNLLSKDYGRAARRPERCSPCGRSPAPSWIRAPTTPSSEPTPAPGIDALAEALANQPGTEAGPPTAVTVDGYPAKVVESTVTADIDPCKRPATGSGCGRRPTAIVGMSRAPTR